MKYFVLSLVSLILISSHLSVLYLFLAYKQVRAGLSLCNDTTGSNFCKAGHHIHPTARRLHMILVYCKVKFTCYIKLYKTEISDAFIFCASRADILCKIIIVAKRIQLLL